MRTTSAFTHLAIITATLVGISGCKVGPNYSRPQVPAPPALRGADEAQVSSDPATSIGDQQWSAVFHEQELQDLIRTALANNFDVRIAAQRVLEQQAQVRVTRSQQFPQISVGGSALGADFPGSSFGDSVQSPLTFGGFNLQATWTPDFWGMYRRQTEAARAQLLAQTWAQRAVRLTLVQQVATTYFQLRALDLQLAIAQKTLKTRQESVELTRKLERGGSVPMSDLRQAEELEFTASSQIPQIEQQIQQTENAMRLLLGQEPGPVAHRDPDALAPPPQALPVGVPSQLLERRPDIQQAEAQLRAANAQVGVARAQFFPQMSLTFNGGIGGNEFSQIFKPEGGTFYGIGQVLQPIFAGGKISGQYELSQRQKEEMILTYRKTILTAFRDVSNALIAVNKQRATREQQQKLVVAAEDATRLARLRYNSGAASYLEVLTTDSTLFTAELNLATAQQNEALTLVQLYTALGGGWQ